MSLKRVLKYDTQVNVKTTVADLPCDTTDYLNMIHYIYHALVLPPYRDKTR